MTAHQLAKKLLEGPDFPVVRPTISDGMDILTEVADADFFERRVYDSLIIQCEAGPVIVLE